MRGSNFSRQGLDSSVEFEMPLEIKSFECRPVR